MVGNKKVWSLQNEQFLNVTLFHKVEPNTVTYIVGISIGVYIKQQSFVFYTHRIFLTDIF
jgi:hypothetical protein